MVVSRRRPRAASFVFRTGQFGFTMVELVIVLVALSILAGVAAPRWLSRAALDERGYAESAVAALRYARQMAGTGCPHRVTLTASAYTVLRPAAFCSSASITTPADDPQGQALAGSAPSGMSSVGLPLDVTFSSDGSTNLAGNADFQLGPFSYRLHARTGVVEAL